MKIVPVKEWDGAKFLSSYMIDMKVVAKKKDKGNPLAHIYIDLYRRIGEDFNLKSNDKVNTKYLFITLETHARIQAVITRYYKRIYKVTSLEAKREALLTMFQMAPSVFDGTPPSWARNNVLYLAKGAIDKMEKINEKL